MTTSPRPGVNAATLRYLPEMVGQMALSADKFDRALAVRLFEQLLPLHADLAAYSSKYGEGRRFAEAWAEVETLVSSLEGEDDDDEDDDIE